MATALGSASRVRQLLGRDDQELLDSEVEPFINEAIRKVKATTYIDYQLDKQVATIIPKSGAVNRDYQTYFPVKSGTTVKVYIEGVLQVVTTNYTLDDTTSVVSITSGTELGEGDVIGIFYTPDFYDDWVNAIAALRILSRSLVDTPEGSSASSLRSMLKEQVGEYQTMIDNKPLVGVYRDHAEGYDIY